MKRRPPQPAIEPLEDRAVPADIPVTSLGDGGLGTLRDAIIQANLSAGPDRIQFQVNGTIGLRNALPQITDTLDLLGPGAPNLTIERGPLPNGEFPLLVLRNGTTLNVSGLRLANNAMTAASGTLPAGIQALNNSVLTVRDCTFDNLTSNLGPVIHFLPGARGDISGSVFTNTHSSGPNQRGLLFNVGAMVNVDSSSFINNDTGDGRLIFTAAGGAGIATTNLRNVTITGTTGGTGGTQFGIICTDGTLGPVSVSLEHSTIVGNSARAVAGLGPESTIQLTGNIFADNGGTYVSNGGTIESFGGNVADDDWPGFDPTVNRLNTDPLLGPLTNNGGPVPTFALLPGSPAIDFATTEGSLATDARGVARPQGAARDAGAVEAQAFSLSVSAGDSQSTTVGQPFPDPLQVVLTEGGNPIAGATVTFTVSYGTAAFGAMTTVTATTDAQGIATAPTLVAGTTGSFFIVDATAGDQSTSFFLFANPEAPVAYEVEVVYGYYEEPITQVDPGQPFSLRIVAVDQYGNRYFQVPSDVAFTSSDPAAMLPPPQLPEVELQTVNGFALVTNGTQTITVAEAVPDLGITGTVTLTVNNLAPAKVATTVSPASAAQGDLVTLNGTFDDPGDGGAHTVTIDWGDGDSDTVPLAAGVFSFSATHTYTASPGTYTIVSTVADSAGLSGEGSSTVDVTNAPPTLAPPTLSPASVVQGQAVTLSGTFTDPGDAEMHFVDVLWGDGTFDTLILGPGETTYSLDHTYTGSPGTYPIDITVSDSSEASGSAVTNVDVGDAPPAVAAPVLTPSSVAQGEAVTLTGDFTDDAGPHTVTIDWGDGTSDTIDLPAETSTYTATHVYTAAPRTYTVRATVADSAGGTGVAASQVEVTNAAPRGLETGTSSTDVVQGDTFTFFGTFADPGDTGAHQVTIDWGDGTTSTINLLPNDFTFSATHAYTNYSGFQDPTTFLIVMTVVDSGALETSAFNEVTASNVPPEVDAGPNDFVTLGDRFRRTLRITDPGGRPLFVMVDYGDGDGDPQREGEGGFVTLQPNANGNYVLDHVYDEEHSYLVRIWVTDNQLATTSASFYVHAMLPAVDTVEAIEIVPSGDQPGTGFTDEVVPFPSRVDVEFHRGDSGDDSFMTAASVSIRVAAVLPGLPDQGTVTDGVRTTVVASFDLRGVAIQGGDFAVVTFRYANDDDDLPRLFHFDELLGSYVEVDLTQPGASVDLAAHTITFTFSDSSDPTLQSLVKTVFTITVPLAVPTPLPPTPPPPPTTPVASASAFFPLDQLALQAVSSTGQDRQIAVSAYDGPGTVAGKAVAALLFSTSGIIADVDLESDHEPTTWFIRRARGEGALADLPPPPAEAAALPGVTLTPAEPRALDFGPPTGPRRGAEEEEEFEPMAPDEFDPVDEVFSHTDEWTVMAGLPLLLPLAGMVGDRGPSRRRR